MAKRSSSEDSRRFEVTVHSTDGDQNTYCNLTNRQARDYEDLPFTTSNVTTVEVRQTR